MPKMSTDLTRHALNGPTMGTRWSAGVHAPAGLDPAPLRAALQAAVDEVDAQMSTWKPDSDLMRLNAAPPGQWLDLPKGLLDVLAAGLETSRRTGGAFEMNLGDAVRAWGFGPDPITPQAIAAARAAPRRPSLDALELDLGRGRARKHAPLALDLSGIAKGHGVDRLAEVLAAHGIAHGLCAIDGELRAVGARPDGSPWSVAVESPEAGVRRAAAVLTLADASVATSGDYRHFVEVAGQRLSHTMDPARGAPLIGAPASVTVLAPTCREADALATALMVMGADRGRAFAADTGISALFLLRGAQGVQRIGTGVFAVGQAA